MQPAVMSTPLDKVTSADAVEGFENWDWLMLADNWVILL